MTKPLFLALGCVLIASVTLADDRQSSRLKNWPHWRGPQVNGVAPLGNPPAEWSEEKNLSWKVEIPGRGSATPIVWNDDIFVLTAIPTEKAGDASAASSSAPPQSPQSGRRGNFGAEAAPSNVHQFVVLAVDRRNGKIRWRRTVAEEVPHEGHHNTNTFASASPITDGERLYASFGSRGVYCLDLEGNVKWKRDLGDMQTRNGFGEGASPALHQDTLVVNWDHEGDSFIVALDANTGEQRWKVDRDEVTTWATPLIVEHEGRTQVVVNGSNRVRSYDLATGEVLWECGGQASNPIPTPVTRDGVVYAMTGFRGFAVYAIPLDARGDISDSDEVLWRRTDTGPYISSPVLYDGLLYFTKGRDGILSCVDAKTGQPHFDQKRLAGLSTLYASPVAAAGRVYFVARDGTALALEHGPELKILATNKLSEGIDASPAIVGKQMFLRGEKHLYCVEERATPKQ